MPVTFWAGDREACVFRYLSQRDMNMSMTRQVVTDAVTMV